MGEDAAGEGTGWREGDVASSDPPTCSSLRLEEKASVANAGGDFSF